MRPREVAAKQLHQGEQVGHGLARMIHVVLHVDDRRIGVLRHLVEVFVADPGAAVTDGDAVAVAAQHHAGVLGVFAVADLRRLGGQPDGVAAELGHARLEGVARPGRFLEEKHVQRLGAQDVIVQHAGGEIALELERQVDHGVQVFDGPVGGGDEVLLVEPGVHISPYICQRVRIKRLPPSIA